MHRMPIFLRGAELKISPMSQVGRGMLRKIEDFRLPPKPESGLLRSEGRRWRIPQRRDRFFDQWKDTLRKGRKTQSPVARLRQLLMCMGAGSLPSLDGDPTLMSRIEA